MYKNLYFKIVTILFCIVTIQARKNSTQTLFSGSVEAYGFSIKILDAVATPDGGAFLTGQITAASSLDGDFDSAKLPDFAKDLSLMRSISMTIPVIHKVDAQGKALWTKIVPVGIQGSAVAITPDKGFVVVGFTPTNRERLYKGDCTQAVTVFNVDSTGKNCWYKIIPSNYNSTSEDVLVLPTGEILILANRAHPYKKVEYINPTSFRLLKLSSEGELLWDKELPAETGNFGYAPSKIIRDKSGQIYLYGSNANMPNAYIAAVDSVGELIWDKEFSWDPEFGSESNHGSSIALLDDGFVLTCTADNSDVDGHHIFKVNKMFDIEWDVVQPADSWAFSDITVTKNNEIFFVATTEDDEMQVVQLNPKGEKVWDTTYTVTNKLCENPAIIPLADGNVMAIGNLFTSGMSDRTNVYHIIGSKRRKKSRRK